MSGPRYSQAGMQALKHGEAAYRAGDRIVPARQALNLLAAVDDLPPAHDCPGRLRRCVDHPGWRVFRTVYDGEWYAIPPGPETFPTPAQYMHDTWTAAHQQVRAEQLAAITHSEGTDALPADLETP